MVQSRISGHQYRSPQDLLQFLQVLVVTGFEDLRHLGMHAQYYVFTLDRSRELLRLDQDLADDRLHALDVPGAFAIWARRAQGPLQTLLDPFSGDRHQPEIIELENLVRSAVSAHRLFQRLHDLLAVLALIHVDEIDHDDAAQIP